MMAAIRPARLQLSRARGFNLQRHSVETNGLPAAKVARPGMFGNPFRIGEHGTQDECVDLHRKWLNGSMSDAEIEQRFPGSFGAWLVNQRHPRLGEILRELSGKNVACFCKLSEPCHGDFLVEVANGGVK